MENFTTGDLGLLEVIGQLGWANKQLRARIAELETRLAELEPRTGEAT